MRDDLTRLLEQNPRLAKIARDRAGLPEIAALLLEMRHQLGLSQKELAQRARVPKTTISELENAANDGVTLRTLAKIARGAGLRLDLRFECPISGENAGQVLATLDLLRYPFNNTNNAPLAFSTSESCESGLAA